MATTDDTPVPVQESAPASFPTLPSQEPLPPRPVDAVQEKSAPKTPSSDGSAEPVTPNPEPSPSQHGEVDTAKENNKRSHIDRVDSQRSEKSNNSGDIDMDDEDDVDDASENESVDSGSNRPSKKKKGQRFFCTEYPPCRLSFTRSEHLARHIRKHTGERPFQCHCLRKFSRLDNLRQHAQTVHVNEEIPGDSLAATGTRFQRQIRTDRMRTPGNRSRATTIGSQPPYSRGHSRNVSGSSISSIPSDIGSPETSRRPQPLAPSTPRGSISVETYGMGGSPQSYYGHYYNQSPSGYSTPTSLFSVDQGSPRDPPRLQSPVSIVGRSLTWGGGRVPNRRLSVPSGPNPFQPNPAYPPPGVPYMPPSSAQGQTFPGSSSVLASPTTSVFSSDSRQTTFAGEAERKRRTWHPSTYTAYGSRPATSGLSYYQTPDAPQPVNATQPAATQAVRLPGIDSFDRAHGQPLAPPRRLPSPMEVDNPSRTGSLHEHRRHRDSWGSMDQNLNRLDLSQAPTNDQPLLPDHSQPLHSVQQAPKSPVRPAPPPLNFGHDLGGEPGPEVEEEPVTPKKKRRQAWYNGPVASSYEPKTASVTHRTSPEGSSSSDGVHTPSTASAADYHPAIRHSNGFVETHPPGAAVDEQQKPPPNARPDSSGYPLHPLGAPVSAPPPQHRHTSGTDRLDALVAVATSEEQAMKS